jgi:hypothetical protein
MNAPKKPIINTRRKRTNDRHETIRRDFKKYDLKTHRLDYVLNELGNKFFLTPETIYAIVKKIGRYKSI